MRLRVEICGSLDVEELKNSVTTVFITNKRTNDKQSTRSDSSGRFCRLVVPEVYIVAVSLQ